MGNLGNSMDLPFEPNPEPVPLPDKHGHIAVGLVVMASTAEVPGGVGRKPALVFRFMGPEGEFYPPVVYIADDEQMAKMRPLIMQAIAAARRAVQAPS